MPDQFHLEVKGLSELRFAIKKSQIAGGGAALRGANKAAADIVVRRALPNVPVGRTGKLRGSVRALGSQTKGNVRAGSAAVPYAAVIHWGRKEGNVRYKHGRNVRRSNSTRGSVSGRPFLWDALQAALDSGELGRVYLQSMNELTRDFNAG